MVCCSRRDALIIAVLFVLSSSAGFQRSFTGTYAIVNQASGRRMSLTVGGFSATAGWPIVEEQKWIFVPQDDSTYTIVNAKNKLRVLAQNGMDFQDGFFAVDSGGPIYEDHRWKLDLQDDGSYSIINVRSNRRIIAETDGEGGKGFGAVRRDGIVQAEERWWLINLEKDETGKLLLELDSEQRRHERLGEQFKAKVGEMFSLQSQMRSDRAKYIDELESSQRSTTKLQQRIEVEKKMNMALAEEVIVRRNETAHARSDLNVVNSAMSELAEKMQAAQTEIESLSLKVQLNESATAMIVQEVETIWYGLGWLSFFPAEDFSQTYKLVLIALALVLIIVLPAWGRHFLADLGVGAVVSTKLSRLEASRVELASENAKKQAIIVKLQEDLDRAEALPYPGGDLGHDFAYQVFNTDLVDSQTMRLVKVQCPGVMHEDIEVQLIFNGCEVTIARKASRGVEAITWRRRFYFKPSEGLFEFKEDQMQLEHGFLHLAFAAYNFQSRVIRFPRHFTMNAVDNDGRWEFDESEDPSPCDESGTDLVCTELGSHMDSATTASVPISTTRASRKKRLSLSNWWASDDGDLDNLPPPDSPIGSVELEPPSPSSPMQLAAATPRNKRVSGSGCSAGDDDFACPSSAIMQVASPTRRLSRQLRDSLESMAPCLD